MATNPTIRRIPRDKLFEVFKTPELVKLMEDLMYGVGQTLPENTETAQVTAATAQAAALAAQGAIDDHITAAAGAHAASAISVAPIGGITSIDAQGAFAELDAELQTVRSFARSFLLMGA